jgi:hypothetical protein
MSEFFDSDARIKVVLEMLVKYSGHDDIKDFICLCQDLILKEMYSEKESSDSQCEGNNIKISRVLYDENGQPCVEYYFLDKWGKWWCQWQEVPFKKWGCEKPKWKYEEQCC